MLLFILSCACAAEMLSTLLLTVRLFQLLPCVMGWQCRCGSVCKWAQLRKGSSLFSLFCAAQYNILISNTWDIALSCSTTHVGPLHPTPAPNCCPSLASPTCKPYHTYPSALPPPFPSPRLISTTSTHPPPTHHKAIIIPFTLAVSREISPWASPTLPYPALPCPLLRACAS